MLWKAADCDGPLDESRDITNFGGSFEMKFQYQSFIAEGDLAPHELLDVIQCQCQAQGKKCSTEACGCHKQHLSCTTFCNCNGRQDCLNPFTTAREAVQPGENVQSGEIVQSVDEETEMGDVDSNHPDHSDNDIEHDKEVEAVRVTDDQDSHYVDEWE